MALGVPSQHPGLQQILPLGMLFAANYPGSNQMEQRILVTQATPGMIIARPVLLPDRMVLVGEGAVMTEQLIGQLMTRGIKRIVVRGQPIQGTTGAQDWPTRMAQLDERFDRVRYLPIMQALRETVARVMARRS